MNFNRVILCGYLTRDPQSKALPSGMSVAEFGIAMNRKSGKGDNAREEVTFVDCAAFDKTADMIAQYFHKGSPILIEGRLKYDTWEDKGGGGKRSKLSVIVSAFDFVGGKRDDNDDQGAPPSARRDVRGEQRQRQSQPSPISGEPQFRDDDIPF
jgi:single-strand DNA-binding protein